MIYGLKILYHLVFALIMYFCAVHNKMRDVRIENHCLRVENSEHYKLSIFSVLIFCFWEGIYSYICGEPGVYLADREVYASRFVANNFIRENSPLLVSLSVFLREFTNNPDIYFFVVASCFMLLTCTAYNKCEIANPYGILLLGLSLYNTYGCYQLKQSLAVAFTSLAVIYFLRNKKILCIAFTVFAILSHETGYILVPLFILLIGSKNKWIFSIECFFFLLCIVVFPIINGRIISLFIKFFPALEKQLISYLDESGSFVLNTSSLVAIKGIPLYIISFFGFVKRKELKEKIENNEKYLLLAIFSSVATLLSTYMNWLWRFSEMFYLIVFLYGGAVRVGLSDREKKIYDMLLISSLSFVTFRKLIISYINYGGIV